MVEAAGWRVCRSRQGQTGNDEVIAKLVGGGGARRSDIDSEMSSAAEAWAPLSLTLSLILSPTSLCCSAAPHRFGHCQCFVVTRECLSRMN